MRSYLSNVGIAFSAFLAATLLFFVFSESPIPISIFVLIGAAGWLTVVGILVWQKFIAQILDEKLISMGLTPSVGGLGEKVTFFISESLRFHRAAFHFNESKTGQSGEVATRLQGVLDLAYYDLNAQAVQLLLFDKQSGLYSQSMSIGFPTSLTSTDDLEKEEQVEEVVEGQNGGQVVLLRQSVSFGGNLLAIIWVEFKENQQPSSSDRLVLKLLSTQTAVILVSSNFTEEMLKMRRKGEESVRAKTGFLANLSHEIRGPLGVILNSVELILEGLCGPVSDSQRDTLNMVRKSSNHLLDLVNDVLDYAKLEAGKIKAQPVAMPLKPLLDDLRKVVQTQAAKKKHKLTVSRIPDDFGIRCDKRHIRQMLINLLTNAIKYTKEGGEITVSAEKDDQGLIKISVKDNGVGIPSKEKSKVFSAFERVQGSYAEAQLGTGLGMPLTRKLAEVNNGYADFESEEGKGSTFWISIPAEEIKNIDMEIKDDGEIELKEPQGRGETVLLVDHDDQVRGLLEKYLSHQGFKILHSASGKETMDIIRKEDLALAIIENDMPDMSGEEIVEAFRGNSRSTKVPIVMLSSRVFVFDIERFLKLGVDRLLAKPVNLAEIAITSRQLIDETAQSQQ